MDDVTSSNRWARLNPGARDSCSITGVNPVAGKPTANRRDCLLRQSIRAHILEKQFAPNSCRQTRSLIDAGSLGEICMSTETVTQRARWNGSRELYDTELVPKYKHLSVLILMVTLFEWYFGGPWSGLWRQLSHGTLRMPETDTDLIRLGWWLTGPPHLELKTLMIVPYFISDSAADRRRCQHVRSRPQSNLSEIPLAAITYLNIYRLKLSTSDDNFFQRSIKFNYSLITFGNHWLFIAP